MEMEPEATKGRLDHRERSGVELRDGLTMLMVFSTLYFDKHALTNLRLFFGGLATGHLARIDLI